jgi:Spy/CpxP family protein refolding chaperone
MAHTSTRTLSTFSPSRATRLVATGLFAAVLGTVTLSTFAQPGGHGPGGMHGGPGMGMMHGGGPGMGMMGGRGMERMLDSVNASAEQRTQIRAIFDRARTDMQAQHESGRALRQQMMTLFTQPVVDANAVEALRQQGMQHHDAASRRMTQAMVEASRVLSPEQRKQLADQAAKRSEQMQRHLQERRGAQGGASAPR